VFNSPERLTKRTSNMSMQELCRLQASTPVTAAFEPPKRQRAAEPPDTASGDEPEEFIVSCIIPNYLYLGPEPLGAPDVRELEGLGIKQILNMALEVDDRPELGLAKHFEKYYKIPMRDFVEETGVQKRIDEACDMLGASACESDLMVLIVLVIAQTTRISKANRFMSIVELERVEASPLSLHTLYTGAWPPNHSVNLILFGGGAQIPLASKASLCTRL
jgi:hypothetical protein